MEFWDHLSVHFSDDKLFRCDRCPFRTPLKHHMTSHRMNHDDDKPFSCDLCSYRAVSQSMVNSHRKSHSTVRPYVCDYPNCHYSTKFVNQLTKHREKQHPGFMSPGDGVGRRRPSAAAQLRQLCYPDDQVTGLPPTGLPQAAANPGLPPMPSEIAGRNGSTMLPWSVPPWSPFNFFQRMAAAAAVTGLSLQCPTSTTMSLPAQRSVDVKPFQLPPLTLPTPQPLDAVAGERGSTSTPQKLPVTSTVLDVRHDVLNLPLSSPLSTTPAVDMDARRSLLARLVAASRTNNQVNVDDNDYSTSAPAIPQSRAPAAVDNYEVTGSPRTLLSPGPRIMRSNVDGVSTSRPAHYGRNATNSLRVPGPVNGHDIGLDDHPLDLTAKASVTAEHAPEIHQEPKKNAGGIDHPPVRKTSRRKGVAHKLDTSSINHWPPNDMANEPFELISLSSSPPSSSRLLNAASQQSSSLERSPPKPRGGSHNACEATVNGTGHNEKEVDDGIATEAEYDAVSRLQLLPEKISGGSPEDARKDDSMSGCLKLDGADPGLSVSTTSREECRHCGFVFKHTAMYDIHMGFHKFDEPWRCNRCGYRCTDCVDFNRHIATASHVGQV